MNHQYLYYVAGTGALTCKGVVLSESISNGDAIPRLKRSCIPAMFPLLQYVNIRDPSGTIWQGLNLYVQPDVARIILRLIERLNNQEAGFQRMFVSSLSFLIS